MPYPILIGLIIVVAYLTMQAIKSQRASVPTSGTPPPPAPKRSWWMWLIALVVIALAIMFGPGIYHRVFSGGKSESSKGTSYVVWTFTWTLPPGQIRLGRNSHTLDVVIKETGRTDELWAVLYDKKAGVPVAVGDLRLGIVGERLTGAWTNYLDGDGGKCYLTRVAEGTWSGHEELMDGSRVDCTLKRKVVSKP